MEIQIISVKEEPTRTGKDKWLVKTGVGDMSVWDEKLAKELGVSEGTRVDIEIRPAAKGTNYLPTITKIVDAGQILKEVQNGERSLNGQSSIKEEYNKEQKPIRVDGTYCGNYNKDKSIIAQCLVKAVIGQHITIIGNVDKTQYYRIDEAVKMYKEALELLG